MAHASTLVFAGIAPHPPIMVPEVGRDSIVEVQTSIDAMADFTARVIASGAQTIVMISPHAPLDARAFVAYDGPQLYGDFANFRAPAATVQADVDEELLAEITRMAAAENLETLRIKDFELDHGTAVPLYFLQRNGWRGRVVALGYTFLSNEEHILFGKCVRLAIDKVARPVAFVASGDLSHRLKPEAPAGFNPQAHLFDEEIVDAIYRGNPKRIVEIDQEGRRLAGECGYRSILVALGVAEGSEPACEVMSYEAPFGVGYLVAQLVRSARILPANTEPLAVASGSEPRADISTKANPLATTSGSVPALARRVIETFVNTSKIVAPPKSSSDILSARAGCFVSIKTHNGDLRGCIGTVEPVKDTLAEEIITNAVSAATRDPRFPPVRKDELPDLKYSVDVLSAPEPTTLADLDPKIYGVIVEDETGTHRGLLLPNLEGIDTASHQVEIASRKAGIAPGTPVKLFRFRADRYSE
jgi:MEMO1 family protein